MDYEKMTIKHENNLIIKEKPLKAYDGRIKGNKVLIRNNMSQKKKLCVLAEEIGHYYTTVGDILDQSNTENRKQELRARIWAYDSIIGLGGIIKAYKHGCKNLFETADYLEVTEEFLSEALQQYTQKYGTHVKYGEYEISFIPALNVCVKNNE